MQMVVENVDECEKRMAASGSKPVPSAEVVSKWQAALEMRQSGMSYKVIAQRVGYTNEAGARNAVFSALELAVREPAEAVLTLELHRLDLMQEKVWDRAMQGDIEAQTHCLRIMDRRAKYLGLVAPESTVNNFVVVAPDARVLELLRRGAERDGHTYGVEGEIVDGVANASG